jgi:CBS domain containing-hemolysin-like protein
VTAILAAVFNLLTGGRTRRDEPGGFSLTLQGLREYFAENAHPAALSEHQHGMIDNLASMHRISVRQVMRPAAALPQIPLKSTVRQALERIRSGEDELLAVQGGASRQIVGFVSLFALMDPELQPAAPVQPLVEKPVRIAAGMPLTQAFRVLRRHGGQTAAVVDRSARVIGLLHIRDIARYIVKDT